MDSAKEVPGESPFKPGECLCGIPNCAGHERVDGKITFKGHPVLPDGEYEFKPPSPKPSSTA